MWAEFSFVLSEFMCCTDERTDGLNKFDLMECVSKTAISLTFLATLNFFFERLRLSCDFEINTSVCY